MPKREQITKCRHCGQRTTNKVLFKADGAEEIIDIGENQEVSFMNYYYLTKCKSCSEISLFGDWDGAENTGYLDEARCLYPPSSQLSSSVPNNIQMHYEEAKKVQSRSPVAFAVLIRKCLEQVCKDQDAKGRNLKEQIEDLARENVIPETLSKTSNAIRYFGNVGAHEESASISWAEARTMDDLFRAIIEYVYVAPAMLEELRKKVKKQ